MRHYFLTECDLAIINGGFLRGDKLYPEGYELTLKDILMELPFPKIAKLIKIKGVYLKEAIEQQLTVAPKPSGSFPHFSSGSGIIFDPSLPVGQRLKRVFINDEDIDDEQEYVVVLTDFVAQGGDGCVSFLKGKEIVSHDPSKIGVRISQIMVDYLDSIEDHMLSPVVEDRVVEVGRRMTME